jgi:hypothetical protein
MADSGSASSAAAEEYVSLIDELIARPFPAVSYQSESGCGGPGHHLRILQESEDFWDDPYYEASREAEERLEADLRALTVVLAARWGEPRTVDLWQYLQAGCQGDVVPEPVNTLCQQATSMQVWPLPGSGRWLALTIGQGDKELPFELIAAVGEASALVTSLPGGQSPTVP